METRRGEGRLTSNEESQELHNQPIIYIECKKASRWDMLNRRQNTHIVDDRFI